MPYQGELANKASHGDVLENPAVQRHLQEFQLVTAPTEGLNQRIANRFVEPPPTLTLPDDSVVITVDGSNHCVEKNDRIPPCQMSFSKVGTLRLLARDYQPLVESYCVDPFAVATLGNEYKSISYALPGHNVRTKDQPTTEEALRHAINQALASPVPSDGKPLMETLFFLASLRKGLLATQHPDWLLLDECPTCQVGPIPFHKSEGQKLCCGCGSMVYTADALGLWKESESLEIQHITNLVMSVLEHLLLVHNINQILRDSPEDLGKTAFLVDGPLAIFGWACQWLHAPMMATLHQMAADLKNMGLEQPVVVGIQKTGYLVDHANLINRFVPSNSIFPVSDDYRYDLINSGIGGRGKYGFGSETYYGQDFIYASPTGRVYVIGLPYPFKSKDSANDFRSEKVELARYPTLDKALSLINYYESDMYANSLVPIILAHGLTSISATSGGTALDVLASVALGLQPGWTGSGQVLSPSMATPVPVGR